MISSTQTGTVYQDMPETDGQNSTLEKPAMADDQTHIGEERSEARYTATKILISLKRISSETHSPAQNISWKSRSIGKYPEDLERSGQVVAVTVTTASRLNLPSRNCLT